MKNLLRLITLFVLLISQTSCDFWNTTTAKREKPDLLMPEFISGSVLVASEMRYTFIQNAMYNRWDQYPYGLPVYITNTANEFYSLERIDPATGIRIVFYWQSFGPALPFHESNAAPFHPLQEGEIVKVHRCVFNQTTQYVDYAESSAGRSSTRAEITVRVSGQQIEQSTNKIPTAPIPPGSYTVIEFPITVNINGEYSINFEVDTDDEVDEESNTNNNYIERINP
jgi:hypothetical protein